MEASSQTDRNLTYLAQKYARHNQQVEVADLKQLGAIAAWQAEQSWRPDGGANITTWQYRHASLAMRNEVRRQSRHQPQVELIEAEMPLSYDTYNTELLEILTGLLTPREIELAQGLARGATSDQMAKELKISQQRLSQLKQAMRNKLKTNFSKLLFEDSDLH
ncbi:MAG: sigma factor [Ferrimicrobium sp.]